MRHHNVKQLMRTVGFYGIAGVILFTSCLKIPADKPEPELDKGSIFNFVTTRDYQFDVNYGLTNYPVLIKVYDRNPMQTIGGLEVMKDGLEPVFRAITDARGCFSGKINMATSIKEVYLCCDYIGVPMLIKLPVKNKTISFKGGSGKSQSSRSFATRAGGVTGDLMTLGGWNNLGTPDNMLTRVTLNGELMRNITYSLPESKHGIGNTGDPNGLIRENEAIGDIKVLKNTKINLIFMHEGASMTSTLGYYCYPTNNPPTSVDQLKRVVAFPNFSYAYATGAGELSSGDRLQLKYWNGTELVDEFPAGTTIGWFLISSGFKSETAIVNGNSKTIYYTNPAFNPERQGKQQHCVALRDQTRKIIALGFEDQNRTLMVDNILLGDSDFNDAVYYIQSDVDGGIDADGIPDIIPDPKPEPDPADNFITYSGTLVFEDLWPSKGDYDMNDLVIEYKSTHHRDRNNYIIKTVDQFVPRWQGATLNNGFGYQLGISGSRIQKLDVESNTNTSFRLFKTDAKGLELRQSKATIMLFENAADVVYPDQLRQFTVTAEFTSPVRLEELMTPPYNPFLVCGSTNKDLTPGVRGKEVHLPYHTPTDLADRSLFGTGHDKTNPSQGRYYLTGDHFAFALKVPISFDYPEERQSIDKAYSRYSSWVSSGGENDADWYMDKKNPK